MYTLLLPYLIVEQKGMVDDSTNAGAPNVENRTIFLFVMF